nr:hypothetical protein [uncultured Methanoregula sp.]
MRMGVHRSGPCPVRWANVPAAPSPLNSPVVVTIPSDHTNFSLIAGVTAVTNTGT